MIRFWLLMASWLLAIAAGWLFRDWKADAELATLRESYAEAARIADSDARAKAEALRTAVAEKDRHAAALEAERAKKSKVLTREVVRYVQSPDAGRCRLPGDGVRLHDAAAAGGVPEAAGSSGALADAAGTFTDAELIPVVVENYQTCHEWRARLIALQSWVEAAGLFE